MRLVKISKRKDLDKEGDIANIKLIVPSLENEEI